MSKKNHKKTKKELASLEKELYYNTFCKEAEQIPIDRLPPKEQLVILKCIKAEEPTQEEFALLKEVLQRYRKYIQEYQPKQAVENAENQLEKIDIADVVTEVVCEECGKNMVIKYGPHGKFLACPGFPECKNTKPYFEKIGVNCPNCGEDIVIRKTKKGRKYYGCINNPDCDFMTWAKPVDKKCPQCGKYMVQKGNKVVCSDEKCGYME